MTPRSGIKIRGLGYAGSDSLLAIGTAIAVTLGLQLERVFISTMIFAVDQSNRTELARNAILVFTAIGLVAFVARFFGVNRALAIGAALLAGCRVIVQFTGDPDSRWPIAAVGFIGWGWLMVAMSLRNRSALAIGLIVGLVFDLSLRAGFDSIDLAQMQTPLKDGLTLLLAGGMVISLAVACRLPRTPTFWSAPDLSLLGFGAGIGMYALVTGNLGLPLVNASTDLRTAFVVLALGLLAAGVVDVFWREPERFSSLGLSQTSGRLIVVLIGFASLHLVSRSLVAGVSFSLALVTVCFCCTLLTIDSVRGRNRHTTEPNIWHAASFMTFGLLLHGASVFLYFASSGSPNWVALVYVVLALAGLLALRGTGIQRSPNRSYAPLAAAASAAVLAALLTTQSGHIRAPQSALAPSFTVVTYNIQNGFSRDNHWDLEATARTIESLDADIVLLQETGRGWFAIGWSDQVGWLSERLNMQVVFGPASKDDLWGNTILSVAPLSREEVVKYTSSENLSRSVVSAVVETGDGDLWVASTHLDNPKNSDEVRIDQTTRLIEIWDGQQPAVIGGDFNMSPDEDAIRMIEDAGLVDATGATGQETWTSEDGRRIDFLFVSPDLIIKTSTVPDVSTSDHRPVAIELEIA